MPFLCLLPFPSLFIFTIYTHQITQNTHSISWLQAVTATSATTPGSIFPRSLSRSMRPSCLPRVVQPSPRIFVNPSNQILKEVLYTFPLYDGISVVGFERDVGGQVICSEVKTREQANTDYLEAVSQQETAVLMDYSITEMISSESNLVTFL